jgi:hypothetical protein
MNISSNIWILVEFYRISIFETKEANNRIWMVLVYNFIDRQLLLPFLGAVIVVIVW